MFAKPSTTKKRMAGVGKRNPERALRPVNFPAPLRNALWVLTSMSSDWFRNAKPAFRSALQGRIRNKASEAEGKANGLEAKASETEVSTTVAETQASEAEARQKPRRSNGFSGCSPV